MTVWLRQENEDRQIQPHGDAVAGLASASFDIPPVLPQHDWMPLSDTYNNASLWDCLAKLCDGVILHSSKHRA